MTTPRKVVGKQIRPDGRDKPDYYLIPGFDGKDVADLLQAYGFSWHRACAVKYLLRAGRKPGVPVEKDLGKAWDCVTREIEELTGFTPGQGGGAQ